ncbi:hypothetical protein MERGE_001260 [Pneumocystis wakefieldiae]|uniref:Uncharacterized protein n=1 Tax=Pneumocystis wakefieldiae TaxID=38082 RepID=A0A899G281_9ASCO|nr:hypothetical protein MERGE_001260 [Pneumocystis wakefieldiae]
MGMRAMREPAMNRPDVQKGLFSVLSRLHLCEAKDCGQERWSSGVLSCIFSLHHIIDHFFEDSMSGLEGGWEGRPGQAGALLAGPRTCAGPSDWEWEALPDDFYEAIEQGQQRFEKCTQIIQHHLNQSTPYASLQHQLHIKHKTGARQQGKVAIAYKDPPGIKCFAASFWPNSPSWPYVHQGERVNVRSQVKTCKTNTLFQNVGPSFSSCKSIDVVVEEALNDLNQFLTISQPIPILDHKSGSRKNKSKNLTPSDFGLQKEYPEDVAKAALNLISSAISFLPPGLLSSVQRSLIDKTVISVALFPDLREKLRKQIYNSLINNVLSPGNTQAIILPHVIRIFEEAGKETDIFRHQMKSFSHMKFLTIDAILHPRFPPLQRKLEETLKKDNDKSEILQKTNEIYFKHLKYDNISNTADICHVQSNCSMWKSSEKEPLHITQDAASDPTVESEERLESLNQHYFKAFLNNDTQNNHLSENILEPQIKTTEKETNLYSIAIENESNNLSDTEIPIIVMEDSSNEE